MWDTPQSRAWLSSWLTGWIATSVSLTWDWVDDGYIWLCRFATEAEWPSITSTDEAQRLTLAQAVLARIS